MGLANFDPEVHPITFKSRGEDVSFTVRGLTLADISRIIGDHVADIEAAYELYQSGKNTIIQRGSMDALILQICRDAPGLVAEVISTTADEPDLAEKYAKIPFSVSAVALAEIMRMTLEEQGGLKNLSAALVQILKDVLPAKMRDALLGSLPEPQSPDSTGD